MYCPSCGANQAEGRRFCTNCGTNLWVVSQALSAPPRAGGPNLPPRPDPREAARQRELASGVKLALIGGAFVALQFFSFIFSLPFRRGGSTFGFWGFVALALWPSASRRSSRRARWAPRPRPTRSTSRRRGFRRAAPPGFSVDWSTRPGRSTRRCGRRRGPPRVSLKMRRSICRGSNRPRGAALCSVRIAAPRSAGRSSSAAVRGQPRAVHEAMVRPDAPGAIDWTKTFAADVDLQRSATPEEKRLNEIKGA